MFFLAFELLYLSVRLMDIFMLAIPTQMYPLENALFVLSNSDRSVGSEKKVGGGDVSYNNCQGFYFIIFSRMLV